MLRGIRRLFATLAVIFGFVSYAVLLTSPHGQYFSNNAMTIAIEAFVIYAIGWIISFIILGFRGDY